MKSTFFWLLPLAVALMATNGYAQQQGKPKVTMESVLPTDIDQQTYKTLFSAYPKSDAFLEVIQFHRTLQKQQNPSHLVLTTYFSEGKANVAAHNWVSATGKAHRQRNVYNWAIQSPGSWQLTDPQFSQIKKMIATMPASNPPASLKNLLIVTYYNDNKPVTRLYDLAKLPAEIVNIGRTEPGIIHSSVEYP